MTLDAFRDAVLSEAQEDAARRRDEAERDAQQRLQEAEDRATTLIEEARREGREDAERASRRLRAEARRRAREQVLRARSDVEDQLRRRLLSRLREDRTDGAHDALADHLRRLAREQLGDDATIDVDERHGGFVARRDGRVVDYRFPSVVERALEDLGTEIEELWR